MSAGKKWPLGPLIVGLGGFCVLIALGVWQFSKVAWKNGIIAEAENRLLVAPEPLPAAVDPERDNYKRVIVEGVFDHAAEQYVLTSLPPNGPGFDVVTPFESTGKRRILINRGFVPQTLRDPAKRADTRKDGTVRVEGVLRWPQDSSAWTIEGNVEAREWYSREVGPLATATGTEPIMILQSPTGGGGWPRGGEAQVNIRNQHLPYAIQWFAIAAVWALMSFIWLRKVARSDAAE